MQTYQTQANCLTTLAQRLTHLLPVCPAGTICAMPLPVAKVDGGSTELAEVKFMVQLTDVPDFDTVKVYQTNGDSFASTAYTINYATNQITFTSDPGPTVFVDYTVSLAEEFVMQAVQDLGQRLPRKQTDQLITTAPGGHPGVTPLPPGLIRILSLCRVDCGCTCQETSCPDLCGSAPCFQCSHCATYIDAGNLVQTAGPCKAEQFDICYLAGYPLDKYGCFTGLTPDLADLVMLKAQSLAYRTPQMLLAISGLSISTNRNSNSSSSTSFSGGATTKEVTTTVKTTDNCGKDETTVVTKEGSTTSSASKTASSLSSLFSTSSGSGLAEQYETLYMEAIYKRTSLASLTLRKRQGYRASVRGAYC